MCVVRRIQEDLEVVVMEDHGVVFRDGRPYVRLLHKDGEVHSVIIVCHLGPGREVRGRAFVSLDIHEVAGPRYCVPFPGRKLSVDLDRSGGLVANIRRRIERWLRHIRDVRFLRTGFLCARKQ